MVRDSCLIEELERIQYVSAPNKMFPRNLNAATYDRGLTGDGNFLDAPYATEPLPVIQCF
jgi:hypothetical protein